MKVAIIGAGVAGIVSLRYVSEAGHECDCFEETGEFGGTWVYSDKTGTDENGLKIYRTMYKDLITNLPKEVMFFKDFSYPEHIKESYLTQPQVLQYLTDYVKRFNLEKHIKYYEVVVKVQLHGENQWMVTTWNVKTKAQNSKIYDGVFVCNGHFRYPKIPTILGQNTFKGMQVHSSEYRKPNHYVDKRVLIIGASFSGRDVADQIKRIAKKIYFSHWSPIKFQIETVVNKTAVVEFLPEGAVFADGTKEDFDVVIYCTGYEYKYPFLDNSCGITVEENWVQYLYKHVVNIQHPTMYFIGIPFLVPAFLTCDIQAQFSLSAFEKKFNLPSREEMLKDLNDYMSKLKENNVPYRHVHKIGMGLRKYFEEVTKVGCLKPFPRVFLKLYEHKIQNPGKGTMRYVIVDNENFIEYINS